MDDVTGKLRRLDELHQKRVLLQDEEDALAADLATSSVRGVRTAMARILGVTVEALRLRYGPVPSITTSREPAEK
ncbi:hypothetical protein [Streptomyces sp. NPDC056817]|uniref:hypothetical protein n=1 Tax=Streptomyces sp. NPDC056817 TaxID=3345950 RepID=UPI0036AE3B88